MQGLQVHVCCMLVPAPECVICLCGPPEVLIPCGTAQDHTAGCTSSLVLAHAAACRSPVRLRSLCRGRVPQISSTVSDVPPGRELNCAGGQAGRLTGLPAGLQLGLSLKCLMNQVPASQMPSRELHSVTCRAEHAAVFSELQRLRIASNRA